MLDAKNKVVCFKLSKLCVGEICHEIEDHGEIDEQSLDRFTLFLVDL